MDYVIRAARHEDLPEIIEHLKECSKLYKSKRSLMRNVEHVKGLVVDLIDNHYFIVACDVADRRIHGFVSGMIHPYIYDPMVSALAQIIWYVDPKFRRKRLSLDLLDKFIEFGKKNVDLIIVSIQDYTNVSDKAFTRRGFKHKELNFIMEVN